MIDLKSNMERRITKTIEDNPKKFMMIFKVRCVCVMVVIGGEGELGVEVEPG